MNDEMKNRKYGGNMDVLTKEQRRKNMQNIKSKDTSIELALRKALWREGYRYMGNYKKLPGKPDIALVRLSLIHWRRSVDAYISGRVAGAEGVAI